MRGRKQLIEQASRAFDPSASPGVEERTQRTIEDLYAKIGQLTVERVLCPRGPDDEQAGPGSQARPRPQGFVDTARCPLLSLSRSGGVPLMRRLDELNTAPPFLGSRRMIAMLRGEELRIAAHPTHTLVEKTRGGPG